MKCFSITVLIKTENGFFPQRVSILVWLCRLCGLCCDSNYYVFAGKA